MRGRRLGLALLAALALVAAVGRPAEAAREKKQDPKYTVSEKVGKKLVEVHDLIQAEQNQEAVALLDTFDIENLKPYPAALVHQAYGFIEVSNDDFEKAAAHFQQAVELEALPPTQQLSMRFNLGQIYMMLDRWDDAIATFETWFAEAESPSPIAFYMLALAYYQAGDPASALAPAIQAVERAEAPNETWMQLLLSLLMAEERYADALPVLERLVLLHPKKVYWTQISGVLAELGREEDSLAAQQIAYASGLFDESRELVRLSQTCVVQGIPWQGAKIMGEGLEDERIDSKAETWHLYANTLLAARENEKALEPLERAASLADDGEGYLQLGQVHLQAERWSDALDALSKALDKGGLEHPGQVHLLMGVAAYQEKSLVTARRALTQALADAEVRDTARQWLEFVEREQARESAEAG